MPRGVSEIAAPAAWSGCIGTDPDITVAAHLYNMLAARRTHLPDFFGLIEGFNRRWMCNGPETH
jgi:hypothetical protein